MASIVVTGSSPIYRGFVGSSRMGSAAYTCSEHAIDALDAPVIRVSAKDTFVPNAPNLEAAVLPNVDELRRAVDKVLHY
jgi:pyruvate/2-oxoglutarate/acetoin dehydrogenase E1 component